ncbi:hypothetical protein B4098_1510 [Heyndrickxia coagulans]|uniref:Uncharacterized protein n=1 Tax=Heyndrickxia coagulans TaxID=1398 RepID=A0A150KGM3_HEYCO|nr:hypothetical protein B4098_1510 [Heyndrickxia coagulans]KYC71587.1 hypothetical protein B4099_1681 [Heyndrickxia coagulans]
MKFQEGKILDEKTATPGLKLEKIRKSISCSLLAGNEPVA